MILAGSVGLLQVLVVAVGKSSDTASLSDASRAETAAAAAADPDLGRLVARFALAKASGFNSMVAGMDSLRRAHDVMEVPPVWLEGVYLSDAAWYPEVEEFCNACFTGSYPTGDITAEVLETIGSERDSSRQKLFRFSH